MERRGASRFRTGSGACCARVRTIWRWASRTTWSKALSGTGKTSVCDELQRRGYHAVNGDRELAYQGDPTHRRTGTGSPRAAHEHHLWHVDKVRALVARPRTRPVTFFCGGSRNFPTFIDLFDGVFVLEVDLDTLHRRLDERPGRRVGRATQTERELVVRLHHTRQGRSRGTAWSSTPPHRSHASSTRSSVGAASAPPRPDATATSRRGGARDWQSDMPLYARICRREAVTKGGAGRVDRAADPGL